MRVYLASASPRRRLLLTRLGVDVVCVPMDVKEMTARGDELTAQELACGNALMKIGAARRQRVRGVVLAADTVVTCGGRIYGKPRSFVEAARFLRELRGRMHEVVTGVAVANREGEVCWGWERSGVIFKDISDGEIQRYLLCVDTLDKAGGYSLQERSEWLIAGVIGSVSNIIGLPVELAAAGLMWAHGFAKVEGGHVANLRKIAFVLPTTEKKWCRHGVRGEG